jgi:hypothetical protein
MITAGRMQSYPGEFWVGMGIFSIIAFLCLMTEIYWRKRIEWEREEVAIWEDLFYGWEYYDLGPDNGERYDGSSLRDRSVSYGSPPIIVD